MSKLLLCPRCGASDIKVRHRERSRTHLLTESHYSRVRILCASADCKLDFSAMTCGFSCGVQGLQSPVRRFDSARRLQPLTRRDAGQGHFSFSVDAGFVETYCAQFRPLASPV